MSQAGYWKWKHAINIYFKLKSQGFYNLNFYPTEKYKKQLYLFNEPFWQDLSCWIYVFILFLVSVGIFLFLVSVGIFYF